MPVSNLWQIQKHQLTKIKEKRKQRKTFKERGKGEQLLDIQAMIYSSAVQQF